MATTKRRLDARTSGHEIALAGFDATQITVHGLLESGYSLVPYDGIGGSVLELRSAAGALIDHPDGTAARVEFDDAGVIAAAHSEGRFGRGGFEATFDASGWLASMVWLGEEATCHPLGGHEN